MRKLGWVLVAFLVALPVARASEPCRPADGTRITQTSPTSSLVTLTWDHSDAKVSLQVAPDDEFAKRLIDRSMPCCDAKLKNLERGRYYWRVLTDGDEELCRSSFEVVAQNEP